MKLVVVVSLAGLVALIGAAGCAVTAADEGFEEQAQDLLECEGCGGVCLYQGEKYGHGDTFPAGDKCNSCTCMKDGSVACTDRACKPTYDTGRVCFYDGEKYRRGDTFAAGDGCNSCVCMHDGSAACTKRACKLSAQQ